MACITDLNVSLNEAEEQNLQAKGFNKINVNLNRGAGGHYIYIWYKQESGVPAITRVQVTFNDIMAAGLINSGYTKIDRNLNAGAGGDNLYLWYYRGQTEYDTPIVGIDITTDADQEGVKIKSDWERLACDLNRKAGGNWIHLWVKREKQTYICDVTATDSFGSDHDYFQNGYIRVDEDTNRGAGGAFVFIWYRQTTDPERALTALNVSTNDSEYQALQQQKYTSVSVNLNEGTKGGPVYLWYKKEGSQKPIKAMTVLINPDAVEWYVKAGATVIKRNLNSNNDGMLENLCFYQ